MAENNEKKIMDHALAERLLAAHDGDVALLSIYLALYPDGSDEAAAGALCRTRADIAAAREKLERICAAAGETPRALPPEEGARNYDGEDIAAAADGDAAFSSLITELGRIIGAIPSKTYLTTLMDMYDHLGMPPAVIMLLLNHCAAECERRYGPRRKPSPAFISKEAYRWVNREIMTVERAEDYIAGLERRRSDLVRLAETVGIRGRELSQTETKYAESWLEYGFSDELIAAAYDRTLSSIGVMKWPYMNKILLNWNEKGLRSAADVERAEGRHAVPSGGGRMEFDQDELDEAWSRIVGDGK